MIDCKPTSRTRQVKPAAILSLVLAGLAAPAHASLLGFWTFDNGSGTTVTDVSGNGHNGTLSATGATWTTGMSGGGAINLSSASDGFVNMGNPSAFAFGGFSGSLATFTVQAWINSTETAASLIAGEQINSYNEGYTIATGNFDPGCTSSAYNGKAAGFTADGGGFCVGVTVTSASTTTVNDGNWHQLVFVDNNGVPSIYVDGAFQGTGPQNGTLACPGANFVVGGVSPTGSCPSPGTPFGDYTGLITDVGVWNQALTSSQVQAAFQDPNNPNAATGSTTTPEPASFALGALGLIALCVAGKYYGSTTKGLLNPS